MVVSTPLQVSLVRRPVRSPRRELRTSTAALTRCPQSPGGIDSQLGPSSPWDSINSPPTSSHRLSYSEPILSPRSPISTGAFSPVLLFKEESASPPPFSPCFRAATAGSLERKSEGNGDDSDNKSAPLPGFQSLLPYHESHGRSHTTSALRTPSTSPEPSEGDVCLRRPSLFLAQDPITEKLNHLRIEQNKEPLPPLEALCNNSGFLNQATGQWTALQHVHSKLSQQPKSPREVRHRRSRSPETRHSNVKYLVEEADYIRYQRVDYGHRWSLVQSRFRAMFPMTEFPLRRKKQGLQGVCYRKNKFLPRFHLGQLVFMENGHVEPICVKTREQSERKHEYTLVYLFPDRAMNYPWVSSVDRQRAREINEKRQKQKTRARLRAIERGTYIEKLPADVPCGCCPGEDRKRDMEKLAEHNLSHVKDKPTRISKL
ncbi:hypothetical protein F5B21DRAFT_45318 [Xylaria acuta]|nr:hypothetical protein F5B21DRAFT_45318 [Xylaria acuta]